MYSAGAFLLCHLGYLFGFFPLFISEATLITLLFWANQIGFLVGSKFIINSNLKWIVNFPVKRKSIVLLNILMSLYYLLLGACFTFIVSEGYSLWVSLKGNVPEEKRKSLYDLVTTIVEFFQINYHYGNLVWLFVFCIGFFSWFGFKHQTRFYKETLLKYYFRYFSGNNLAKILLATSFICLFYGVIALGRNRILSGFSANILLCSFLLVSIYQSFAFLNDRTKSTRNVLRSLVAIVIIAYVHVGYQAYRDVKNDSLNLNERIKSYLYLGYFAPSISDELYKKITRESRGANEDITRVLSYENLIDKEYLYKQLSLSCDYEARSHIKEVGKETGKLSYKKFDALSLIAKNTENCSSYIVKNYDQKTLDIDEAVRILEAHFEKFKSTNSWICKYFSERKFKKKEIKKLLNSDHPHSRQCGIILSRYYPREDWGDSLYDAYLKVSFHDITQLYLTYVATTGKRIDYKKFKNLSRVDWRRESIECPSEKKIFVDRYDKLDYAQKVHCPYIYLNGKINYDCGYLNRTHYVMMPELGKLSCF